MKLKRYGSRKLYDLERKAAANLDVVREVVIRGEDLEVVDARTGQDRTAVVLAQVIVAQAEAGRPLSIKRLRALIVGVPDLDAAAPELSADLRALLAKDEAAVRTRRGK
jgi:polyhydroxyalkanoate synthesis regulator protein